MRAYLKALLFVLAVLAPPAISQAGETIMVQDVPSGFVIPPPGPGVVPVPAVPPGEPTIIIQQPVPIRPPHVVKYGCSRVWRCDPQVCEWRRGCWGVYGYMEGPYYNVELAKRQWERHGWASPTDYRAARSRISVSK